MKTEELRRKVSRVTGERNGRIKLINMQKIEDKNDKGKQCLDGKRRRVKDSGPKYVFFTK